MNEWQGPKIFQKVDEAMRDYIEQRRRKETRCENRRLASLHDSGVTMALEFKDE